MTSAVDSIQKISTSFLWPSQKALPLMRKAIEKDSCCTGLKARAYFLAQIVASVVAIPFTLIASVFVSFYQLFQGNMKEAVTVIPAALIFGAFHISFLSGAAIGSLAPMKWTNKYIDCFEMEKKPQVDINVSSVSV